MIANMMSVILDGQNQFTKELESAGEQFWLKDFLGDRDIPEDSDSDCEACKEATPTNPIDRTACPLTCRVPNKQEGDSDRILHDARGLAAEVT